jgi:hypothetical protein
VCCELLVIIKERLKWGRKFRRLLVLGWRVSGARYVQVRMKRMRMWRVSKGYMEVSGEW